MASVDTLFEQLGSMTVLELVELKKKIEDEWGITAAAPVAVASGPAGGGEGPLHPADHAHEHDGPGHPHRPGADTGHRRRVGGAGGSRSCISAQSPETGSSGVATEVFPRRCSEHTRFRISSASSPPVCGLDS